MSDQEEKNFVIDTDYQTSVVEGKASVQFPGVKDVFYNPVQEFNRDLSIAVLRLFARDHLEAGVSGEDLKPGQKYENGINILEALAASGLRSIRYAKEIGGVRSIVANDLSASAVDSIKRNSKNNDVEHLVTANEGDACLLMYQHRYKTKFHCVDLDPYGSPSPFIDAAVQCVEDGGLLMVTATDMAVLCGNMAEACYVKYGSISLKNKACHEMALRILLHAIQSSAGRYGRYITPLLSVSVDFYVRLFMLVNTSKKECKSAAMKTSTVYQCVNCHTLYWQPLMKKMGNNFVRSSGPPTSSECEHCRSRLNFGGPFWTDPIHDSSFVASLLTSLEDQEKAALKTAKRIHGILTVISEELEDVPLYYGLDRMASFFKLSCPPIIEFRAAILNAGYRVSLSHCYRLSIKTDAPPSVVWDIVRHYAKLKKPNDTWPKALPEKPAAIDYMLSHPMVTEVNLTSHPDANPDSRRQKLVRFQTNPEKNWGPKARAKSSVRKDSEEEKRSRRQNKKRRLDDANDGVQSNQ